MDARGFGASAAPVLEGINSFGQRNGGGKTMAEVLKVALGICTPREERIRTPQENISSMPQEATIRTPQEEIIRTPREATIPLVSCQRSTPLVGTDQLCCHCDK